MSGLFGKSKTISTKETKIGALRVQNSSQGLPVPLVYGTTRISSNLLWYGDFTAHSKTTHKKSGGKGGGKQKTKTTTYTYTVGVIFGFCEGPVSSSSFLGSVWSDKDVTTPTKLGLTEFRGSYTQNPWSYLTTNHSNQALAYRGDCYAANGAFDLGSGSGLPNLTFEVDALLGAGDQNPAAIVSDYLTADKYGAGWAPANLGNLSHWSDYCAAAGFLISPAYVAQQPASATIEELAQIGNAAVIWSDGLLKVVPYADEAVGSWTPDLTVQYQLGYSDFMTEPGTDPVHVERKRQADAYNSVKLEVLDRSNQYNTYIAEAKDQLAIDLFGLRPKDQLEAHAICDVDVARTVAQTILQRELYVRNVYSFTVGWRYARLEPMDIVGITDAALNLVQQPVRILSVEEDENGFLAMTAEELNIGVSTPGTYAAQPTNGATPDNNTPPGNAAVPVILQPPVALSGQPQLWIGASGGPNWGGAEVWASPDGTTYDQIGVLPGPAAYGVLTANFATGSDPDTTHTLTANLSTSNGVLEAAANEVADALGTLCYIAGANGNISLDEYIAYTVANLTAPYTYAMSGYIRRGQAGSVESAHSAGSNFMKLDSNVGSFDLSTSLMGTTVFIKLLSYNTTGGALQELSDVNPYTFNTSVQVVTDGSGVPFYADRSHTSIADPGAGYMRFNNASQSSATIVNFDNLSAQGVDMTAFFASIGSAGFLDLRDSTDTNKWATYTITGSTTQAGFHSFNIGYTAGGAEFKNNGTVVATFSPTPPTGVTSVGLSAPSTIFTVANSPITGNGTIALTFNTSTANVGQVPTYMGNGVVSWNTPSGGNGGGSGIGSVALNMPTAVFTVANSPLTANGTLDVTFANQIANVVFAGPTTGNAAAPTFRALVPADVPFLLANPMTTTGDMIIGGANGVATRVPIGSSGYVWTSNGSTAGWAPATGGNGGGGNGTTKVTASNVALGSQNASQTAFTYTTVPLIAARGFIWDFFVTANVAGVFDIAVRGAGNDSGNIRLQANSVSGLTYRYTSPVYWENDAAAQNFYVGIRNRGPLSANFTLTSLGVEKTA